KIQNPKSKILWLCLACVVAAPFVRAAYYADYTIMIGRYYMPALAALSLLIVGGLARLPRLFRRISMAYVVGGIAMTALMTPFVVLAPMYRPPALLDPIAAPADMQVPQSFIFGDAIQLLGYRQPQPKVAAGGFAPITLYWRALKPMPNDYLLSAEAFEVSGRSLGRSAQVHPGEGTFPTSRWRAGDTFAQTVFVPVGDASAARVTFRLNWLDVETRQPMIAPDAAPKVGAIAVAPKADAFLGATRPERFAAPNTVSKTIYLLASEQMKSNDSFGLKVWWQAKADALPPATVFLHVLDAQGKLVAQLDTPIRGGAYPTEVWSDGEIVVDTLSFPLSKLPAGALHLRLGLYDPVSGQRWAVSGGASADAVELGVLLR
ncbi:MAG: hypothetical protein KIH69_005780, partial [Anaerolineae bacterium]|nr:hypothetical protein [Anaerolineae bacterium]